MKTKDGVKIHVGDLLIADSGDVFEVSDIYGSTNECYLYKVTFTEIVNGVQFYRTDDLQLVSGDLIKTMQIYKD